MQRSISTISLNYEDNSAMDSDICNMFGSLNLRGWAEGQGTQDEGKQNVIQQNIITEPSGLCRTDSDSGRSTEDSAMMEVTDSEGNIQFISASPKEEHTPGCGLLHLMHAHYVPSAAQAACSGRRDTDFNLLETILTHREAFVSFPYGHRTCSQALTRIAFELEKRHHDQVKGSDGDLDTAIALHNEAWLMSGWYSK
ncbi:hypothetical protein M0805_009374 [Coniferiporia weirii]|nr:hypothetical protein M0805_009374 [Coniferiporia weirii]